MQVYLNGSFVPKDHAHVSVDDRGFLFGDGVYEVVRSYGGRLFELEAHLARLERGLRELRIEGVDADFHRIVPELLRLNDMDTRDAVVYMQVTRGVAPRRHAFPVESVNPTSYAAPAPVVPKGDPQVGVDVITVPDVRWARCDIKSVNLLGNCLANQRAQEAGAAEAILVRDGVALEASASSLFGVFDGEVRTAPNSNYILPGITRAVALELCAEAGVRSRETPILFHQLFEADELFLAGTTVELLPVVRVDGRTFGAGTPGPISRQLYSLFALRTGAVSTAAP